MAREFDRDFNHPCIFSWVIFNETWGLFTGKDKEKKYLPETQEWVRSVYHRAKENDPTRIVEDNSPCNYDHVETDINTWHFYINGYKEVKAHIEKVVKNTFPGSRFNCAGKNTQSDAPLMNSECGMVWAWTVPPATATLPGSIATCSTNSGSTTRSTALYLPNSTTW